MILFRLLGITFCYIDTIAFAGAFPLVLVMDSFISKLVSPVLILESGKT